MEKFTTKHALLSALIGLGGAAYLFYPTLLLFYPAFLAFVGVCWGWGCLAIAGGVFAAIVFAFCGGALFDAAAWVAIYLPASFLLTFYLTGKKPYRNTVAVCSAYFVAAIYCAVCLPSLLEGGGPFDHIEAIIREIGGAMEESMLAAGATQDVTELFSYFRKAAILLLPEIIIILLFSVSMLAGFVDTLIASTLCRSTGARLRPMAPFHLWQLSRSFTYGMTILLAGSLIAYLANINNATALICAVQCLVGWPLALMGGCVIAFSIKMRPYRSKTLSVLTYGALVLFIPYSIYALSLLGLIDKTFRLRKKFLDRIR